LAILWGGLACGVLDIIAGFVIYRFFGARPMRLLQGIASGLLGPRAFTGGIATALLGLVCHFLISFAAATVYVGGSALVPVLGAHTIVSGMLYGVAVYFFMNHIVVPLSAAPRRPFSSKMMVIGLVIHMFCVGLPIAVAARRFSA
jgi:hypothetical protein